MSYGFLTSSALGPGDADRGTCTERSYDRVRPHDRSTQPFLGENDRADVVRNIRAFSETFILILTTDPSTRSGSHGVGAVGHLPKPFRVDELGARVRTVLDRGLGMRANEPHP